MGMTPTMIMTDYDDDNDVKEEVITPQDDNESSISTGHNLDPAMEQLVDAYAQLNIRSREASHHIAHLELGLASCILHAALYFLLSFLCLQWSSRTVSSSSRLVGARAANYSGRAVRHSAPNWFYLTI
jgi:hypothetical protein